MLLEYQPRLPALKEGDTETPHIQVESSTEMEARKEVWNLEQIGDFVRKLGFLDKEKEGGDKIKQFLYFNQVL